MTRFFIVRHGETEWNRKGIFRGRSDIPLSETGRAQARALGWHFSKFHLKTIVSSPQGRALETARAIAKAQRERRTVHEQAGFAEMDRGEWEGLTHAEAREKFPTLYRKWFEAAHEVRFPKGESLRDVQHRARRAFDRLHRQKERGDILIVTHHVVLRALLCSLLNIGLTHFRSFEVEPGSVSEILRQYDRFILNRLNDACPAA